MQGVYIYVHVFVQQKRRMSAELLWNGEGQLTQVLTMIHAQVI